MFRALSLAGAQALAQKPIVCIPRVRKGDGSFFEWMCVHVAHRLGQCIGHTEGLPICAHDVNDMIQNLGFRVQGPGFGCQFFFYCVALDLAISGCVSPL